MNTNILKAAASRLNGEIIEYEGRQVIRLDHDNAVELAATESAPVGYFYEPINSMLVGVYEV